jgi:copper transport protein
MTVTSLDRAGNPLPLRSLSGRLSSIDAGVSAVDVHFAGAGARWRSTDATVPLPGLWTLQLTASPRTGPAYVMVVEYRVW